MDKVKKNYIDSKQLVRGFEKAEKILESKKEEVNSLNVFPVPDGDTGTNMLLTIKSALENIKKKEHLTVSSVFKAASDGSLMGARGNSGVILSQLLRGLYNGLKDEKVIGVRELNQAFLESKKVAYNAVMKPTEGTILTVARMISEFSNYHHNNYDDPIVFLKDCIDEGNRALNLTPTMLKQLEEAGVVDAGGKGYLLILEGLYTGILNEEEDFAIDISNFDYFLDSILDDNKGKYNYSIYLNLAEEIESVQLDENFSKISKANISASGNGKSKVFILTDDPAKVIEDASKLSIIENSEIKYLKDISGKELNEKSKIEQNVHYDNAFIVVSSGKGIDKIFTDLSVQRIISGGQTMNPSTEDILKAIESIDADNIFILPNNKNIILSAKQAASMTKKLAYVIETRTIPEGISAILSFNPDDNLENNLESMKDAIKVKTLEFTYAVRDSENNGIFIKKDDFIGIHKGEIIRSDRNLNNCVIETLEKIVDEDDYLMTIFYGENLKKEEAEKIVENIENVFEDLEVELVAGGQPVYSLLISIE